VSVQRLGASLANNHPCINTQHFLIEMFPKTMYSLLSEKQCQRKFQIAVAFANGRFLLPGGQITG
jgi:hypothetical protein